jgi:hypothetical protein
MSAPQFASLHAGMLARKGEAQPSKEPSFGHKPWQPPVNPAPAPPPPQQQLVVRAVHPPEDAELAKAKVRLADVASSWPAPKQGHGVEIDNAGWVPSRPQHQLNLGTLHAPFKTTIRLTHAQARAVKLAALVLDKPQQEILTAGLIERLEALACADLAKCSCFHAVIEGLKAPEPAPEAEAEQAPPQ